MKPRTNANIISTINFKKSTKDLQYYLEDFAINWRLTQRDSTLISVSRREFERQTCDGLRAYFLSGHRLLLQALTHALGSWSGKLISVRNYTVRQRTQWGTAPPDEKTANGPDCECLGWYSRPYEQKMQCRGHPRKLFSIQGATHYIFYQHLSM